MKVRTLLILSLLSSALFAQDNNPREILLPTWEAPLRESQGAYTVSLNSICSVALERYDLRYDDKTYFVVECSVETVGGKTARFYHISDQKPKKKDNDSLLAPLKENVEKLLPEENEEEEDERMRVMKVYPESALAATVEYRFRQETEVVALYHSLRDAWVASAP